MHVHIRISLASLGVWVVFADVHGSTHDQCTESKVGKEALDWVGDIEHECLLVSVDVPHCQVSVKSQKYQLVLGCSCKCVEHPAPELAKPSELRVPNEIPKKKQKNLIIKLLRQKT